MADIGQLGEIKGILDRDEGALLIDVREPEEYAESRIPGASLLPLGTVLAAKSKEELDASGLEAIARAKGLGGSGEATALVVYCTSGVRSAMAAKHLESLGFAPVYDAGGIMGWPYETER